MLRELRIRDVAIIEDIELRFGPGLNVISGETGAGKSIILDALGLVLGNRASAEMVRTGRDLAEVQALFDRSPELDDYLSGLGIPCSAEDDGLIVRRTVSAAGRSRAWVNGSSVILASLRQLAVLLVDYGSQQEHRVLLEETRHLAILDRFAGLEERSRAFARRFAELAAVCQRRDVLQQRSEEQVARAEFLRFQLAEFERLAPRQGEDAELRAELGRLHNAQEIGGLAHQVVEGLYAAGGSAVDRLAAALAGLERLVEMDPSLGASLASLRSALIVLEDSGRELSTYASRVREDPARLQELEERLAELGSLARKQRCAVDELQLREEHLKEQLRDGEGLDDEVQELDLLLIEQRRCLLDEAHSMSQERAAAGQRLGGLMAEELASLGMAEARFEVELADLGSGADGQHLKLGEVPSIVGPSGLDRLRFLFSANVGEELRPLARIASGGELSRILLALRCVLSGSEAVQVCVFDEIDAGIGGATAEVVAAKLLAIASGAQVLCITHLPQIAACAQHHLGVDKCVDDGRTRTRVRLLDGGEQVAEMMRLVAGTDHSEATEAFARELLDRARASRDRSMPATLSR
ncbi:MAG: DNA repair protein RecN [Rickettsiales bacterium]|nr:DNA repair protein RecN [Rickettsiales bacterium]